MITTVSVHVVFHRVNPRAVPYPTGKFQAAGAGVVKLASKSDSACFKALILPTVSVCADDTALAAVAAACCALAMAAAADCWVATNAACAVVFAAAALS